MEDRLPIGGRGHRPAQRILKNPPDHARIRGHHVEQVAPVRQLRAEVAVDVVQKLRIRGLRRAQPGARRGEGRTKARKRRLVRRRRDQHDPRGEIGPRLQRFDGKERKDVRHHEQPFLEGDTGKGRLGQRDEITAAGAPAARAVKMAARLARPDGSAMAANIPRGDGASPRGERLRQRPQRPRVHDLAMAEKDMEIRLCPARLGRPAQTGKAQPVRPHQSEFAFHTCPVRCHADPELRGGAGLSYSRWGIGGGADGGKRRKGR